MVLRLALTAPAKAEPPPEVKAAVLLLLPVIHYELARAWKRFPAPLPRQGAWAYEC